MRSMKSREIHASIRAALDEVVRSLAAGEMDRSGRYYTDTELKDRFTPLTSQRSRPPAVRRTSSSRRPKTT
jgi:hypothetical protein